MNTELIHVGFGNILAINKVVAMVPPSSAPTKRMVQKCKSKGMLIDLTSGRRTKDFGEINEVPGVGRHLIF